MAFTTESIISKKLYYLAAFDDLRYFQSPCFVGIPCCIRFEMCDSGKVYHAIVTFNERNKNLKKEGV